MVGRRGDVTPQALHNRELVQRLRRRSWIGARSSRVRRGGDPGLWGVQSLWDNAPYLNLAIAVHAPFLVSRDHDLLDRMKDADFRKAYPWLTILDPPALLAHVRSLVAREVGYE